MTAINLVASNGATSSLTIPNPLVRPVVVNPGNAPTRRPSYGFNGSHYPDNTPVYVYGPTAGLILVDVDCDWGKIAAARRAVLPADVGRTWIRVRPGTLPGSGGSGGSPAMMSQVGRVTDTARVLITPLNGSGSVKFSGDVRLDRVYWTAMLGFDFEPRGLTTTGCTGFVNAWSTVKSRRTLGLGGMITEYCDNVEVVIRNIQVGDLDPAGYGSGYDGNATAAPSSGWLRKCKDVGTLVYPQYLPPLVKDAAGNVIQGGGHNDSIQYYGGEWYSEFEVIDHANFGSNNSCLQIGGAAGSLVTNGIDGPFLSLDNCLLINSATGVRTRCPLPPGAKELNQVSSAINGEGWSGKMNAKDVIAIGSIYTTEWDVVDNCVTTVAPRPSKSGTGWRQDASLGQIDNAWIDARVPFTTEADLRRAWGSIRNS